MNTQELTAMVVPRPGTKRATVLDEAIDAFGSIRALAAAVEGEPSRSTISAVASDPTRGIAKDKAERLASALGRPVGELFVHKDGAPLA
ncbi:hypothetical protein [Nocardioides sp.]|uniref:hypothetical protein n=1 Tax=Nocardioides sp. TaxID=35761 RepID=UPI0039E4A64F